MKIVCGSCQAKYSIADEKVAGKVFKIRCKRCSEVIVVRGDQEEAAAAAPAADDAAADAIWHVVINGEQAGPFNPAALSEMLSAGKLDWESYVWAEGFENWLPMRDVPELVAAISGPAQREEPEPEPVRAAQPVYAAAQPAYAVGGGYVAAQPSMGADPFADDSATAAAVFGASSSAIAQPAVQPAVRTNLFAANGGESPFEAAAAEPRVVASSPRVSVEQAMTGARNENSVLFSLKNLQALATGSSAPTASSSSLGAASNRPGFAGGEGSGLIDIRALATATGVNDQGKSASEKDALLSLGSAQTGAFGALGSPMLAAPQASDDSSKKGLVIAIIAGFALLAATGIAVALILRPQPSAAPPVMAPVVAPPVAAPVAAPAAPPVEDKSEGELAAEAAAKARAAERPSAPAPASHEPGAARSGGGKRAADKAEPVAAAAKAAEPAAPKLDEKPKSRASSTLDDLLNDAIGSKGGAKAGAAPAAAPAANLPDKPSRDDVLNAMNGVKGAVSACANGQSGVAFANITVSGKTGRISNVEVTGMTGEVGSCVARTVRKATFPKFKADTFQVKFPFRL